MAGQRHRELIPSTRVQAECGTIPAAFLSSSFLKSVYRNSLCCEYHKGVGLRGCHTANASVSLRPKARKLGRQQLAPASLSYGLNIPTPISSHMTTHSCSGLLCFMVPLEVPGKAQRLGKLPGMSLHCL